LSKWITAHQNDVIGKIAQREDGAIVGMGWLAVIDRIPVPTRHDRRSGDLQSVFVLPELRGTGLGRQLVGALTEEAHARGVDRIVLHSSTTAAAFYRHTGWSNSDLLLELLL
jgi:GNAT superfamily N-acetyltransferase